MKNLNIKVVLLLIAYIMIASCSEKKVEEKSIEFKSQKLLYTVKNQNSDKFCLLIHGFGDTQTSFESISTLLDSLNIKTVYFDLPGMGKNKLFKAEFNDVLLLIEKIYHTESATKNYAIGHSMGGLILLLSTIDNQLKFDKIITIEPSITMTDYGFYKYIQEEPIGIGIDSFINKSREEKGYSGIYSKNLQNSDTSQLEIYAKNVYTNFEVYQNKIKNSQLKFTYVFGRNSSGLDDRRQMGEWKNVDTISFANAQHWVHFDAKNNFNKFLKDILK